jgi:hypothetical protein
MIAARSAGADPDQHEPPTADEEADDRGHGDREQEPAEQDQADPGIGLLGHLIGLADLRQTPG